MTRPILPTFYNHFLGVMEMKQYTEIKEKLWELLNEYKDSKSDIYRTNIQGMIEALFWVIGETVDDDLKDKIEDVI